MQILGIRTSSATVRYAVIEWDGQATSLINADSENKLDFPADCQHIEEKLYWLHQELERVLRQYPGVSKVIIKMNEFRQEKKITRPSTHMDGVVMLAAMQNNKTVSTLLYSQIQQGMGSKKIEAFAEENVGRSQKYWDKKMADAVAAAFAVMKDSV